MLGMNSTLSHLYSISNINYCKRSAASDLGLQCLPKLCLSSVRTW